MNELERQFVVANNLAVKVQNKENKPFHLSIDLPRKSSPKLGADIYGVEQYVLIRDTADNYIKLLDRISLNTGKSINSNPSPVSPIWSTHTGIMSIGANALAWEKSMWPDLGSDDTINDIDITFAVNSMTALSDEPFNFHTTQQLITYLEDETGFQFSETLARRVLDLKIAAIDEYPDQSPLSKDSLENFISFLESNQNLKCPTLALSYEGNIIAQWRESDRRKISIEFFDDNDVELLVVSPNPKYQTKVIRKNEALTQDLIFDFIRSSKITDLIAY